MASVYPRGGKLWCRVKDGSRWLSRPTPFRVGDEANAQRYADAAQRKIDDRNARPSGPLTVTAWAALWVEQRRSADLDWKNDKGRLKHHILPTIGNMLLTAVGVPVIAGLVHRLRFPVDAERRIAQRTVYNVYSVLAALFRDAAIAGHIEQTPCILTKRQLGPLVDSDPEWRTGSVFTRDEAEQLISDPRIPPDRQLVYALGLLAGLRTGEAAALRWRHYEPAAVPLGRLTVALSYNTRKSRTKGTKTDAVRVVPVHPTLAAMLAEWKLAGWPGMFGRSPEPNDLVVPLPPAAAARRRSRIGDAYRGHDYTGKRWRERDLPALGWRYREPYAMKATFITLAIEDGADRDILRDRVTHAKVRRSAFDGYDRGLHWIETCTEVAKLKIARRPSVGEVVDLATVRATAAAVVDEKPWWRRRESKDRP